MATFNPTSGPAQAWVTNEPITPVQIPTPTTAGAVSYNYTELPEGVEINLVSLVIYGAPVEVGEGSFTLTATDQAGPATYTLDWSVIEYDEPLQWADADDLRAVIGQPMDFQLPVPTGGTPPFTYEVVEPAVDGWPYEARLPAGITFAGGLFSGTPTDTEDNRGTIWYDQVSVVRRTTEGTPVDRLRPIWEIPAAPNNQFQVGGVTFTLGLLISRTAPTSGIAYGPDVRAGGLRLRTDRRFDLLNPPPQNNPFVRVTSVSNPDRQATFPFSASITPRSAWPLFYRGGYQGATAPWLDTAANTGDQFRVEIGTAARYPITLQATDALGSSIRQTIQVVVEQADATVPVPVLGAPQILSHVLSVPLTGGVELSGGRLQFAVTRRGVQPSNWLVSENNGNIDAHELLFDTEYDLWARNVSVDGRAGRAVLLQFRTLFSGAGAPPPPPAFLTAEGLDGKARVRCQTAHISSRVVNYEYQLVRASENIDPAGVWTAYPGSTGATSIFSFPGLINGVEWRVGLRANNQSGPGIHNEIRVTPVAGEADPGPEAKTQIQVLINLTAGVGGQPWFDLSPLVLSAVTDVGRANKQLVVKTGTGRIRIENSTDFIDVEGDSPYRIDSLQDRLILINSVVELPAGNVKRRTEFAGIVESAKVVRKNQFAYIDILLVDKLGLLAQEEVVFETSLPAALTGDRIRYLLDQAGWTTTNRADLRYYNPDLIAEGSKLCAELPVEEGTPLTLNLLDEINLTALSEGGRVFLTAGGDNRPGDLRFVAASPVTQVDGRIQDTDTPNPAAVRVGKQPVVEAEDSVLYNDFELSYPGGTEPEYISDRESIETWGKRTFKQDVRTDQESTFALKRALLKIYKVPRRWISSLPVAAHFQHPIAASLLQDLDLSKSFITEYTPPGSSVPIVEVQRIDGIRVEYGKLDRQWVKKQMTLRLLIPESDVYWITDQLGADAFDRNQTFLAPRRELDPPLDSLGGRLPGGWRTSVDKEYQVVSANRFNALLSQQTMPRYSTEAERDLYERNPQHNQAVEIVYIHPETGVRDIYISQYHGPSFQWLKVASLTTPDANPTFQTLLLADAVRGILGSTNVLAEAEPVADLRS